jgi:signal peptide peptidase SppA
MVSGLYAMEPRAFREYINSLNNPNLEIKEEVEKINRENGISSFFCFSANGNIKSVGTYDEQDKRRLTLADKAKSGVLVVPMRGAMSRYGHMFYQSVSTNLVRGILEQAYKDPNVLAIVLQQSTPGGSVWGTSELAETVKNSPKPVYVSVEDMSASAGYRVAAAASGIYASSPESMIGSIGVLQTHIDNSGLYEMFGMNVTYLVSEGQEAKVSGADNKPLSDADRSLMVRKLNQARDVFISEVKRGRNTSESAVSNDAFNGDIFFAKEAKELGLIDGMESLQQTVLRAYRDGKKKDKDKRKSKTFLNFETTNNMSILKQTLVEKQGFTEDQTLTAEQLNAIDSKMASLTQEVTSLNEDVSSLSTENEKLRKENASLKEQNSTLTSESKTLKQQLSDSMNSSEGGNSEIEEKITELSDKLNIAETQKSNLEASLLTKQKELNTLEERFNKLTEQISGEEASGHISGKEGESEESSEEGFDIRAALAGKASPALKTFGSTLNLGNNIGLSSY